MKQHSNIVPKFVVCVNNKDYEASLQIGKLYQSIPDDEAFEMGLIRVIDEEGEDYGYPTDMFFPVEVPQALARILNATTRAAS